MTDAATPTLAELQDPTKYSPGAKRVAIFKPHERQVTLKNGTKKTVKVDANQLKVILGNALDRFHKTGKPIALTPGHTLPDPATPESAQPPIWGWGINYEIEPFGDGSEIALKYDEYIRREIYEDERDGYKTYPFRSAEYYPDSEDVERVALLRRPPALDLGAVIYAQTGGRDYYCYAMESLNMADTMIEPVAQPDAAKDGEDHEFTEKMMRCMSAKYPKFDEMYMKFAAPQPAAPAPGSPAPAMPSPTNGAPPEPAKKEEKKEEERERVDNAAVNQLLIQYAKLEADVKSLTSEKESFAAERERLRSERATAQAEKYVAQLNGEGFYFKDAGKEVQRFARMTEAEAQERMAEIRQNYQQDPVKASQQMLPTVTEPGGAPVMTEQRLEVAQQYMREGKSWEEAAKLALKA